MRSATLGSDAQAPSAPTSQTATGNDPGAHGWARSNLASPSSARAPTSPTGSKSALARSEVAPTSCSPLARVLGVSRRRLEKLAWALGITKRSTSQISHDGPQPRCGGEGRSQPSPGQRSVPDRAGGCSRGQGARGWQDRERLRARRHRLHAQGAPQRSSASELPPARMRPAGLPSGARWWHEGSCGVVLVISDAHRGLVEAIGETLPGGHLAAVSDPRACGICWPRWPRREQPSIRHLGAYHRRPAPRQRGAGSVPTSGRGARNHAA